MAEQKPPPGVPGYPSERTTYNPKRRTEETRVTHVPPARGKPLGAKPTTEAGKKGGKTEPKSDPKANRKQSGK